MTDMDTFEVRQEHEIAEEVSGVITCTCGRELPHMVMSSDALQVFEMHAMNPVLDNDTLVAQVFDDEDL